MPRAQPKMHTTPQKNRATKDQGRARSALPTGLHTEQPASTKESCERDTINRIFRQTFEGPVHAVHACVTT